MAEHPSAATACLDDATLASYVDGELPLSERAEASAHLASCETCYALLVEVLDTEEAGATEQWNRPVRAQDGPPRDNGPARARRPLVWGVTGVSLALAASLILMVLRPQPPLAPLADAVGPVRMTVVRPTGGFAYGPLRSDVRGSANILDGQPEVLAEVARLQARSASGEPEDLHAYGVAQLISGDVSGSVRSLERAAASGTSAEFEADLGAAYLAVSLRSDDAAVLERALERLERALDQEPDHPEALFNRALALEAAGRPADAIAAWNAYLRVDSGSGWGEEARRRILSLR